MAIQEAKQQHPDMLVTKAVVIRETESPTEELQQKAEVCRVLTVWSGDQRAGYRFTMLCVHGLITEKAYQAQRSIWSDYKETHKCF